MEWRVHVFSLDLSIDTLFWRFWPILSELLTKIIIPSSILGGNPMTGLPHFAAKIKFVQCPKKLASRNARERQREEREREKKIIYFDME